MPLHLQVLFQEATPKVFVPPIRPFSIRNRPSDHLPGRLSVATLESPNSEVDCFFKMMQVNSGDKEDAELETDGSADELQSKLATQLSAALESKFAELSDRLEGRFGSLQAGTSPPPARLPASPVRSAVLAAANAPAAAQAEEGDATALESKISTLEQELASSRQQLRRLRAASPGAGAIAAPAASPVAAAAPRTTSPAVELESLPPFHEKSMGNLHV